MKSKLICLLLLAVIFSSPLLAQQATGPMDGQQYKIELMRGGTLDSKETIVFDHGMMDPLDCHQWGFTATKYEAKKSPSMSTFHATSKSEKEGTMIWQGKVTGDEIEGTMVWTKEGQDPIQYTYKGKEATPEKK